MKLRKLTYILLGILIPLNIIFLYIQIFAFDKEYYHNKIEDNNVSIRLDIDQEYLNQGIDILIDYIKGDINNLDLVIVRNDIEMQIYSDNEKLHMVDVLNLYNNFKYMTYITIVIIIIVILDLIKNKKDRSYNISLFASKYFISSLYMLLLIGIIGGFILVDFNSFWNMFHEVLFTNDLWLLNPRTSIMINMLSLDVFNQLVIKVASCAIITWGVSIFISYYYTKNKGYLS